MWFKMSTELRYEPIFDRCRTPLKGGDGNGGSRCYILIAMLGFCADQRKFRDAKSMSKFLGEPEKQCRIVWDICIEENVLRKEKDGYSALEWMVEKGLVGDTFNRQPDRAKTANPYQATPPPVPKNSKNNFVGAVSNFMGSQEK